ncbi:Serpentine Receptor, class BC (Class B-like) [Caenorhabditis elegans]|uniref:Serpentine Receptor, class BC (Class B-like) n=1 Tax=Caenorhabditis elegans TaxID=6239 RepID=O45789_CAEEL|nr:Serpentine Receptor, class BC (Class B-like) [Caenorhabditis elegans]CAB07483.1 Serpentine Receptor, class BC (Class B-like) [Caenorhabditis elegans]|eukprot:NP_507360.1 Serpentine Receptor, class BC (class B-like) [Caenorhabditis elegans]
MLLVKTSTVIFSFLFTQTVFYLNFYLLYSIFVSKKLCRKPDLVLIYIRISVDMVYSFSAFLIQAYYIARQIHPGFVMKNMSFYLAWPANLLVTIRPILVLVINLDRIFATYFPILYHNHRHKITLRGILSLLLACLLVHQYILFGYCGVVVDVPLDCDHFKCTVNACFYSYTLSVEKYTDSLILVSLVILSCRFVIWNYSQGTQKNALFTKATRIALIDSIIIFIFSFLPSAISQQFQSVNFETVGPIMTMFKNIGLFIEALIVFKVLSKEAIVINTMNNDNC